MSCPFLKPHDCVGCQDDWRCEGATPPFVIKEYIEACLSEEYVGCPHYKSGLEVRELVKNIKLEQLKRDKRVELAMKDLEGILSEQENDADRLVKLKELYRSRLVDLHEYKSELRRVKGNTDGA